MRVSYKESANMCSYYSLSHSFSLSLSVPLSLPPFLFLCVSPPLHTSLPSLPPTIACVQSFDFLWYTCTPHANVEPLVVSAYTCTVYRKSEYSEFPLHIHKSDRVLSRDIRTPEIFRPPCRSWRLTLPYRPWKLTLLTIYTQNPALTLLNICYSW